MFGYESVLEVALIFMLRFEKRHLLMFVIRRRVAGAATRCPR